MEDKYLEIQTNLEEFRQIWRGEAAESIYGLFWTEFWQEMGTSGVFSGWGDVVRWGGGRK